LKDGTGSRPKQVILDTMLWNYLADDRTGSKVITSAHRNGWHFVLPPSILLEALRTSGSTVQAARVELMFESGGRRLASEAELCVDEVVNAVRRLRPLWFRHPIDMATINQNHRKWTYEVWKLAQDDSDAIHLWQDSLDSSVEQSYVAAQQQNRAAMIENGFNFRAPYDTVTISMAGSHPSYFGGTWNGADVDMWRFDVGQRYWEYLTGRPGNDADTVRQFLESYLDVRKATADPNDFRRFWFDELRPNDVKRDWLRAAVDYAQIGFQVKESNARDQQHCSYLLDADLFLSADKRFVEVLKTVRGYAPFSFAEPRLVALSGVAGRRNESILDALLG